MNKIRLIDEIGRVTIPKEIRKILEIESGDPLEINVDTKTGKITIEKIETSNFRICNWCNRNIEGDYEEGSEEGVFYHPVCWKKATMEDMTIIINR